MEVCHIKVVLDIPDSLERILLAPVLLYRRLRYGYPFRRIPLTQGKYAIVDTDDYHHLSKHKWYAAKMGRTFYAARAIRTRDGKQRQIAMHRQLLKVPHNIFVDHINRNGLDNRKANLRSATAAQNLRNRAKFNSRTFGSKYKGVTWHREHKLWQAQIRVNRKPVFLGSFRDEIQAARAYDRAAKKYHGDFASLNFPDPKPSLSYRLLSLLRTLLNYLAYFSSRTKLSHSPQSFHCHAERKRSISFRTFEIDISNLFRISNFEFSHSQLTN